MSFRTKKFNHGYKVQILPGLPVGNELAIRFSFVSIHWPKALPLHFHNRAEPVVFSTELRHNRYAVISTGNAKFWNAPEIRATSLSGLPEFEACPRKFMNDYAASWNEYTCCCTTLYVGLPTAIKTKRRRKRRRRRRSSNTLQTTSAKGKVVSVIILQTAQLLKHRSAPSFLSYHIINAKFGILSIITHEA